MHLMSGVKVSGQLTNFTISRVSSSGIRRRRELSRGSEPQTRGLAKHEELNRWTGSQRFWRWAHYTDPLLTQSLVDTRFKYRLPSS